MARRFAGLVLIVLVGCELGRAPAEPMACTQIGCESQVIFELSEQIELGGTYRVKACIDATCSEAEIRVPHQGAGTSGDLLIDGEADRVVLTLPEDDYAGPHTVSLSLEDPDGGRIEVEADVEFERLQPNGAGCEPVCWQATVTL